MYQNFRARKRTRKNTGMIYVGGRILKGKLGGKPANGNKKGGLKVVAGLIPTPKAKGLLISAATGKAKTKGQAAIGPHSSVTTLTEADKSAYELQREANIRRNNEMLKKLGLPTQEGKGGKNKKRKRAKSSSPRSVNDEEGESEGYQPEIEENEKAPPRTRRSMPKRRAKERAASAVAVTAIATAAAAAASDDDSQAEETGEEALNASSNSKDITLRRNKPRSMGISEQLVRRIESLEEDEKKEQLEISVTDSSHTVNNTAAGRRRQGPEGTQKGEDKVHDDDEKEEGGESGEVERHNTGKKTTRSRVNKEQNGTLRKKKKTEKRKKSLLETITSREEKEGGEGQEEEEEQEKVSLRSRTFAGAFDKKNPTSTNTLAQLNMMSASELKKAVKKLRPKNKRAKFALQCAHRKLFRQWLMQLHAGFNVLLFGVGSKKKTLQRFASEWLTEGPVLVVNGYFPALNLQKILYAITKDIMQAHGKTFATLLEHVEYIREFLPEWAPNVYIVIHNIDGESLRSEAAQSVLSRMASVPQLRVIASVDHVLASMLWSARHMSEFNWLAHDVTTYEVYEKELQYATPVVGGDQEDRARGIEFVLRSLTPNHHEILVILAKEQLEEGEKQGIAFHRYLELCQDAMLVGSEVDMKNHLNEMRDHHLVETRRVDGRELYYIPYAEDIVQKHIIDHTYD